MGQFVTDIADQGTGALAKALPSEVVLPRPCPFNPAVEMHNDGPATVSFLPGRFVTGVRDHKAATVLDPGATLLVEEGLGGATVGTVQAHGDKAAFSFRRGRMVED